MKKRSHRDRLRSAAIVKMKYEMVAGKLDKGYRTVYAGVLRDLELTEEEVENYLEENKVELTKVCLKGEA